jgi:DNA polymerase III delta subunit
VYSFLLKKDIDKNSIKPCYFLYGEEIFLGRQFLDELKAVLVSGVDQDFHIERCGLDQYSWMDVFDLARTVSFFPVERLIVVEIPKKMEKLNKNETGIVKSYFEDPTPQTVMVFIHPFKLSGSAQAVKLFSSLPSSEVREMKPLKPHQITGWMDRRLGLSGKTASRDAKMRLMELAGNDLSLIDNELNKLVTFAAEKSVIDLDDVNQISGWVKSFVEWEITNSLEAREYDQSLIVLDKLLNTEGVKPELLLGIIGKFLREIFLAKIWLKERTKDKKAVFQALKPRIQEKFGSFYATKFKEFFRVVDGISMEDLNRHLEHLGRIDMAIKTSDQSPLVLFEGFLFEFCGSRKVRATSKGWD